MADTADLRNGRDHSATGRIAVYSGRRTTRRLLPDLLRACRTDSVSDNIFAVATHSGPRPCRKGDKPASERDNPNRTRLDMEARCKPTLLSFGAHWQ